MNVKVSLEFEVTPSNDAGLKDLLGHIAQLAASPYVTAQPAEEQKVPAEPEVPVAPVDPEPVDPMADMDPDPEPEPEPKPEPKKKTRSTKKAPESPVEETPNEPASPQSPDPNLNPVESEGRQGKQPLPSYEKLPPQTQEKPKYTVEWVRRLLAEKVGKYRAECKQKLAELGASNVSTLDPSKYSDFVDFLNTLRV